MGRAFHPSHHRCGDWIHIPPGVAQVLTEHMPGDSRLPHPLPNCLAIRVLVGKESLFSHTPAVASSHIQEFVRFVERDESPSHAFVVDRHEALVLEICNLSKKPIPPGT